MQQKIFIWLTYITLFTVGATTNLNAQKKAESITNTIPAEVVEGIKFRSIGPALMSGRISDVAIHPHNSAVWYVTVGSGGVWKTTNAGNTWTTIFDEYPSFSIGCVTIDPTNTSTVWVGTGENVGGRHVGFGDGIYKSQDDGKSFVQMGLTKSEHISKIIVHPTNSDIVWVAAQGPLWSKGGDRGLYKTTNGGQTWEKKLGDETWVGCTDILIDPRNPDVLYAATWQRHRTVAAYLGGGPGTAIYKSMDGGENWDKLTSGLPTSNMGKIGLAISPQKPDVVYAAIELDRRTGAVYRSANGGATWDKMSTAVSGATGPHYYQELYASPHSFDKLYLMDVRIQVSDDGGKTFKRLKEEHKHSDNHAMAFIEDRPGYLLVGTDGGLYETYDDAENWRFFANLPLTQFYDLALDDSEPFYKIYGGTQDNSTQCGPSRTAKVQGIENSDWSVVLDWDGQQPATEPGNPNIVYGQRQEGTLSRIDMTTGEVVDIQPVPADGEPYERWNWDTPILISPHSATTVYFASHRLWKSTNRGDSWTAISGDLTRNQRRVSLPIMGATQSYDNAWDLLAMSNYNTITMIAESPVQEGLIYIGTDDGLIQITEDGGANWRKIEVSQLPGCPKTAYVNEIKADLNDPNVAYVAVDNIKYGDFAPYLYKTTDRGKSWKSIKGNFPDRQPVWRMVQDHKDPNLLFAGTEFGLFVTINGGKSWTQLKGGLPPIPVRDLKIQEREDDLVLATFGRGFYILDDLDVIRGLSDEVVKKEAHLFPVEDTYWYVPRSHLGFDGKKGDQGAGYYVADNPPYGATVTYYLKEELLTQKAKREKAEEEKVKAKQSVSFPEWEAITGESEELEPSMIITISDTQGNIVRKLRGPVKKGVQSITWDLAYPSPLPIMNEKDKVENGFKVAPGTFTVSLAKEVDGIITPIEGSASFEVKPLYKNSITQMSNEEVAAFWRRYEDASANSTKLYQQLNKTERFAKALRKAVDQSALAGGSEMATIKSTLIDLTKAKALFDGNRERNQMGEKNDPTINSRFFDVARGVGGATYGPTKTHLMAMDSIDTKLVEVNKILDPVRQKLVQINNKLIANGGPEVIWD